MFGIFLHHSWEFYNCNFFVDIYSKVGYKYARRKYNFFDWIIKYNKKIFIIFNKRIKRNRVKSYTCKNYHRTIKGIK